MCNLGMGSDIDSEEKGRSALLVARWLAQTSFVVLVFFNSSAYDK